MDQINSKCRREMEQGHAESRVAMKNVKQQLEFVKCDVVTRVEEAQKEAAKNLESRK